MIERINRELDLQTPQTTAPEQDNRLSAIAGSLFRIAIVLIILVMAIWGAARLFRHQFTNRTQGQWLKVVDEVTLGNNQGILLCKLEKQVFVLGVTEHQVNYLFTVKDSALVEEIEQAVQAETSLGSRAVVSRFTGFKTAFSRSGKKTPGQFHVLLQDNLTRIKPLTISDEIIDEREEHDHGATQL
jgi:flagellar biosynthetic protein FliO